MDKFSEKSLLSLDGFYVYGLIDPRNNELFYIGKGTGNRVFDHERESLSCPDSDKLKLKTIAEIKTLGFEVKKIIINSNLSSDEALAAEASLINAFNYVGKTHLSNIVSGHHSKEAITVDDYERIHGAEELLAEQVHHRIMVIKINKLYRRDMSSGELYDAVRGVWRASLKRAKHVDYVFGVYNSLIVAVFNPSEWFVCKEARDRLPRQDIVLTEKNENRIFFVDDDYENGIPMDANARFYFEKSIAKLKNQRLQYPITYIDPV
jgi:hypothetical protein